LLCGKDDDGLGDSGRIGRDVGVLDTSRYRSSRTCWFETKKKEKWCGTIRKYIKSKKHHQQQIRSGIWEWYASNETKLF
jgi:hypothetical protein